MDTPLSVDRHAARPAGQRNSAPMPDGGAARQHRLMSFAFQALSSRWRPLVVLSTVVASVAHIPVIGPHLDEAPYMGVLFIVLTVACFALAATALIRDSRAVYSLVIMTCALVVIGYAATRLVAFPTLSDDVGNWLEPLGIVSIAAESIAIGAAVAALVGHRRALRGRTVRHRTFGDRVGDAARGPRESG